MSRALRRETVSVLCVLAFLAVGYVIFRPEIYQGRVVVYSRQLALVDESIPPWRPAVVYRFYDSAREYRGSLDADWGHLPLFPLKEKQLTKVVFFRWPGFVISWQEKAFPQWGHSVMILLLVAVPAFQLMLPHSRLYVWVVMLILGGVYWALGIWFHLGSALFAGIVAFGYTLMMFGYHYWRRFARA